VQNRLSVWSVVAAARGPATPELLGVPERYVGVDGRRADNVRGKPGQRERHPLTGADFEGRHYGRVLAEGRNRCPQHERVRTGGRDVCIIERAQRRYDPPVAEPDHQLGANGDATRDSFDDPHDLRRLAARGHKVDDADLPLARLPLGLEHERSFAIAAPRLALLRRGDEPATVCAVAEQRREAGVGVKTREAAPVDGPLAVDERRRLQVGKKRVILDQPCH
jgi:hypothetical protein